MMITLKVPYLGKGPGQEMNVTRSVGRALIAKTAAVLSPPKTRVPEAKVKAVKKPPQDRMIRPENVATK